MMNLQQLMNIIMSIAMSVETKKKPTKSVREKELMHKTISNLTDIVSKLQHDVNKIKTRLGL